MLPEIGAMGGVVLAVVQGRLESATARDEATKVNFSHRFLDYGNGARG